VSIRPAQRIGIGYDVHAFASAQEARPLILGGVAIEYARGLLGHSDADVLAHAVADALLGAARLGDIGEHFPDTDPFWAGADSLVLLARVCEMVREGGWRIVDVDSVIVAQAPRLSPYRDEMRVRLAGALGVERDQVGVKATTTERLGFEGRGEGIGAQAVALLERTGEGCVC
jgi:2-C-methyl-D-erythritol 2,4-cyclodiphosphate synthase